MTRRESHVVCGQCGRQGPGRVGLQLCNACRLRAMRTPRNCDGCGEFRRHVTKHLCAACYRTSRLRDALCATCAEIRPIYGNQQQCELCERRARARTGICCDCQRHVPRLYGPRCRPCQRRASDATGRCQDCGVVGELTVGRCRDCYGYARRHRIGECPACSRRFPIGASGLCRMCTDKRRAIHIKTDPIGNALLRRLINYGQARGWSPSVLTTTRASLRIILAARDTLGPTPWASGSIQQLLITNASHRRNSSVARVTDFLVEEQMATMSTEPAFELWLTNEFVHLPTRFATELTTWTNALRGRNVRARKPLQQDTIRSYVWIMRGPLTAWSQTCDSLREVTPEAVDEQIRTFTGAKRGLAAAATRSLFRTLKTERLIFANPAAHLRKQSVPAAPPTGLRPSDRVRLLTADLRRDEHLMVLLAGVHAMRAGQMVTLRVDDIDLTACTMTVVNRPRPLDTLTAKYVTSWLEHRRQRWPHTANPHLLVNSQTANSVAAVDIGHVSKTFRKLGHTAHQLRVDRFLDEVHNGAADPIRFVRLFGVTATTALHYCADATELDHQSGTEPH